MQTLDVRDVEDDFDDMLSQIHNEHVQILKDGERVTFMISADEYRECIKLLNKYYVSSN